MLSCFVLNEIGVGLGLLFYLSDVASLRLVINQYLWLAIWRSDTAGLVSLLAEVLSGSERLHHRLRLASSCFPRQVLETDRFVEL